MNIPRPITFTTSSIRRIFSCALTRDTSILHNVRKYQPHLKRFNTKILLLTRKQAFQKKMTDDESDCRSSESDEFEEDGFVTFDRTEKILETEFVAPTENPRAEVDSSNIISGKRVRRRRYDVRALQAWYQEQVALDEADKCSDDESMEDQTQKATASSSDCSKSMDTHETNNET